MKNDREERSLRIYFQNEQDKLPVDYQLKLLVRHAILATLEFEDFGGRCEVSVTFTDNQKIHRLNREYRDVDRATDVLSFPLIGEDDVPSPVISLGDIVLSLEKAKEQSEMFGHGYRREVAFLTIHSTLHLLGYDHEKGKDEELDMRRRQSAIAEAIGLGVKNDPGQTAPSKRRRASGDAKKEKTE